MTYLELIRSAEYKLDKGHITLGEYEKMIKPLNREIQPEIILCKDCKHNPNVAWFGCPASHLSNKQRPETAWCWRGERNEDN